MSASPGDAITNFAQSLRRLLSPHVRSDLYAHYYHEELAHQVKPLKQYSSRPRAHVRDLLVFHVSIGEPDVADMVLARPERLVVIYHNISPAEPFRPYDPGFADLLDRGRSELQRLRPRATAVLTVSEYNACELRELGFAHVDVLPLLVDLEALTSTPSDAAMSERLRTQIEGPVIMAVGQLLPHKRVEFLIEAFHILSTYLVPDAQLIVVGPPRLPGYASALQTQIDELHLDRAWLTGTVTQPMLAALMRRADLFVTGSEHEGFCVPLLEAMSFDLPVQARRFTAIPETVGEAGLILDQHDGPAVAAESWAALLADESLRTEFVSRGRRRLADFDREKTKEAWSAALTALV
ncbi:MAG: glycosyltransferase [Actinomycetota bacterium]|nr:glycosyltransferase [Actinomycetota bacterium]